MPIISKLGLFQDHQLLRRVVGQPITKAPVHLAITAGKILLCALSAREMDDAAVNVLGSTLINLLHRAFSLQQSVPLAERRKVLCAIDEFHAFSGGDFDRLLSEDAKFGCALLLATQNLKRLNKLRDGLLEMVFANCENVCAFNVSAADAKVLEEELRGQVQQKHILSQPRLHCYARLAVAPYPLQVVSVFLVSPPAWQQSTAQEQQVQAIRQRNQQYTTPVAEIDRQYANHLSQFLNVLPYAQKIQREARAFQAAKRQREAANALAEAVQEDQAAEQQGPLQEGQAASLPPTSHPPTAFTHTGKGTGGEEYTTRQQHNRQRSKRKNHGKPKSTAASQRTEMADEGEDAEESASDAHPHPLTGGGKRDTFWGGERERER